MSKKLWVWGLQGGMSPTPIISISFSWHPQSKPPGQPAGRLGWAGELQLTVPPDSAPELGFQVGTEGMTLLSGVESQLCMPPYYPPISRARLQTRFFSRGRLFHGGGTLAAGPGFPQTLFSWTQILKPLPKLTGGGKGEASSDNFFHP